MLSFGDLKGLLEVNRILVIPFSVLAYLKEFGFSQFPASVPESSFLMLLVFLMIVVIASAVVVAFFDIVLLLDRAIGSVIPNRFSPVFKLVMTSFISFGLLGFYKPQPFEQLDNVWFLAAGAYGLYMLDVHRKTLELFRR
ncbi:hypothetical protein FKQ62_13340 [Vibrio sp. B1-2]|uniref:hypothetical protein n=1 Tax=Vibrio sp. B1-2 TaxID=2591465 RepID=UPI0014823311|nr:hypothetical protein [Vibrio sp. B1-2]NNO00405.1 hypothetical protein [Vibrio sp. B1-2]